MVCLPVVEASARYPGSMEVEWDPNKGPPES